MTRSRNLRRSRPAREIGLVAAQFRQWAGLPVVPVELNGWDNTTFRLGDELLVRLPSADRYTAQVAKEHHWLPVLAPRLPLPIPVPVAMGRPSGEFPRPWSVYRWIAGEPASAGQVADPVGFASGLAGFLAALQAIDAGGGPPAGAHNFFRGGPLATYDQQTRQLIRQLAGDIDAAAGRVWDAALASSDVGWRCRAWTWHGAVHGAGDESDGLWPSTLRRSTSGGTMRRLVLSFWISLDGYSCDEGTELYRVMQEMPDDEQQDEYFVSRLRQTGTHIMGRVTYEAMAEYWPKFDNPVAEAMNDIPKVVFSRTLRYAGWPESRIASGDTAEEIARLKAEPGGEIVAHGGVGFARSLIRLGLVDEYRLLVLPAAVGQGQPLFTGLARPRTLRLLSCRGFSSGLLELVYSPS